MSKVEVYYCDLCNKKISKGESTHMVGEVEFEFKFKGGCTEKKLNFRILEGQDLCDKCADCLLMALEKTIKRKCIQKRD